MHPTLRKLLLLLLLSLLAFSLPTASALLNPEPRCPTYIDTVIPSSQNDWSGRREPGNPFLPTMDAVHKTLSDCSTIKFLKLRVTRLGCSEWPDRWNFPLSFPSGSHYPSKLESLDLEGYDFDEKPWDNARKFPWHAPSALERYLDWVYTGRAWDWLRWLRLPEETKSLTNLDLRIGAMDFSGIRHLALRERFDEAGEREAMKLVPHLKALESLTVHDAWAKEFILALPENSLANLSWVSSGQTGASVQPVLRHHAASLRSLEWREPETGFKQRRVMTAAQIEELGEMAPNLKNVALDMNQDGGGGWPYDHLSALASSFPNLENVTIYFEITSECQRQLEQNMPGMDGRYERVMEEQKTGCTGGKAYADPPVAIRGAGKLFDFLMEKNGGGKLKRVVLKAGDFERPWDGPLAFGNWIDGQNEWVVCEVADAKDVDGAALEDAGPEGRVRVCQNGVRRRFKLVGEEFPRARWEDDDDFKPKEKEGYRRFRDMDL